MENLYLLEYRENRSPHVTIRECEVINETEFNYIVETGYSIDCTNKNSVDDLDLTALTFNDTSDYGYRVLAWVSNNDDDTINKFKNKITEFFSKKEDKLDSQLSRIRNLKGSIDL